MRSFRTKLCSPSALICLLLSGAAVAGAREPSEQIACRSVHLMYSAPSATTFYNEVTIQQSAEGTYFMVCGWNGGYFGLQEQTKGRKVVIFSVWEQNPGDDPKQVSEEARVKVVYQDPSVRVGRFGGEGTGGQSFLDFDWKVGEPYRCLVTARLNGDRSEYAGWFLLPETEKWKHLVTFSAHNSDRLLEGPYSFVEDFRRNKVSATQVRKASFGNGWVRNLDGKWLPLSTAQFTADDNLATNIDAGIERDRFFLVTGGVTANKNTSLWKDAKRAEASLGSPPDDLP